MIESFSSHTLIASNRLSKAERGCHLLLDPPSSSATQKRRNPSCLTDLGRLQHNYRLHIGRVMMIMMTQVCCVETYPGQLLISIAQHQHHIQYPLHGQLSKCNLQYTSEAMLIAPRSIRLQHQPS